MYSVKLNLIYFILYSLHLFSQVVACFVVVVLLLFCCKLLLIRL